MTAPVSRATTIRSEEVAFATKHVTERVETRSTIHNLTDVELQDLAGTPPEHNDSYFVCQLSKISSAMF